MAIQAPYGDIFQFTTPYIDRASAQLHQEQIQRDLMRQKNQAALDDEFAKNMANVKDIDVPEIAQKYGDWKQSRQMLMRKGQVSPEEQLDDLRKRAEVYRAINESKLVKQEDEDYRKLGGTHPENLVDDWHEVLMQRLKTPTSQLGELRNKSLFYTGTDYNSADDLTKAKGQLVPNVRTEGDNDVTYQAYGNTPEQVKQHILGVMGKRDANKFYRNKLMNLPADELVKTREAYEALPDSQFELMGQKKPKLSFDHLDNNADTMATYIAMKSAIENVPRKIKEDLTDAAKMRMQAEKEKDVAAFRLGLQNKYAKGLYDYKHAGTAQEQESIVKRLFDDSFDAGKSDVAFLNGKAVPAVKIRTLAGVGKLHGGDVTFYVTKDKKYVIPRYKGESSAYQDPIPINTFLTEMGQTILSRNDNQSQVDDILDEDVSVPYVPQTKSQPTKAPQKKSIKGSDIATKAAASGYTEKEYRALLKQNGVKIE